MAVTLKDRKTLVVGASTGMGRSAALALARAGARVVAAARRKAELDSLAKEAPLTIRVCDVVSRPDVDRLVADAAKELGGLELVVYCSGTNIPDRAMAVLKPATWDDMIAVNLTGAYNVTAAALPALRAAGSGHLIYISSIAARLADAVSGAAYQAAKRGLTGLAHGTRLEERKHGIRTCVLYPGLCDTEILKKRPNPPGPDVLAQALTADDVADAVLAVAALQPRVAVPELEIVPARLQ